MNTRAPYRSHWMIIIIWFLAMMFHLACHEDEFSTPRGNVTFSVTNLLNNMHQAGDLEISTPAFLVIDIEDESGNTLIANSVMPLHARDESFVTENLELDIGKYKVTKFLVFDTTYTVIYVTPFKASDRGRYLTNPLPVDFSIAANTNTQVVPHVLAVSDLDIPTDFGYLNFDFAAAGTLPEVYEIDLPVTLLYGAYNGSYQNYDSIAIGFYNIQSGVVKRQRLELNSLTSRATGTIKHLPPGEYKLIIEYFKTIKPAKQSEIERRTAAVKINSNAAVFLSNGGSATITQSNGTSIEKLLTNETYYMFYLPDSNAITAIVTLPANSLNPFFEISLMNPEWSYFYADRTFYETRPNEPGSHYVQGAAAFEQYNANNQNIDYVDSTALNSLTETMHDKNWTTADCLVIFYIGEVEQPIFYYQWHNGDDANGRKGMNEYYQRQPIKPLRIK